MKIIRLTFLLAFTVLVSCTKPTNETTSQEKVNSEESETQVVEKFVPVDNMVAVDTTVESLGIQIIINEKLLETYVTNEYTVDKAKHIDKYRDTEWQLKILKNDIVLIDTVLTKENLGADLDKEFLEISNFHGYWINRVQADTIDFFGVISKPETDWAFAFYHYFDTKTRTFTIKEEIDDEI